MRDYVIGDRVGYRCGHPDGGRGTVVRLSDGVAHLRLDSAPEIDSFVFQPSSPAFMGASWLLDETPSPPEEPRGFRVGDEVEAEFILGDPINHKSAEVARWDYESDMLSARYPSVGIRRGVVVEVRPGVVVTKFEAITGRRGNLWRWPAAGSWRHEPSRPGWLRHVDKTRSDTPAPVEAKPEPATLTYIHEETIGHYPGQEVPACVLAEAVERGEAAVRRRLRAWPDGKDLAYHYVLAPGANEVRIQWTWEDSLA